LEETGGSKDAIVVNHTHTGTTNTTGEHVHNLGSFISDGSDLTAWPKLTSRDGNTQSTTSAGSHSHTLNIDATGSSGTNANLQPYITVAMWKRTA
jgi:hypothetical protein